MVLPAKFPVDPSKRSEELQAAVAVSSAGGSIGPDTRPGIPVGAVPTAAARRTRHGVSRP